MFGVQQVKGNPRLVSFVLLAAALGGIIACNVSFGLAVGAAIGIALFAVGFANTEMALYILVFSMLLSPQFAVDHSVFAQYRGRGLTIRYEDILLFVIGLGWFVRVAVGKEMGIFLRTPLNRPIALYLFACALATTGGWLTNPRVNGAVALFFVLKYFEYFVIYLMAANHLKDKEQIRRFVIAMLAVCLLVCLYGVYQMPDVERISAPFEGQQGEPNTLGGYMVLMLALVAGLLATPGSSRHKGRLVVLFALILVTLAATHSRGSWLALPPMILVLIRFCPRRSEMIVPLLFSLALAPLVLPDGVIDRALYTFNQPPGPDQIQIGNVRLDTSTSARLDSWSVVLSKDFLEHPLIGYGITGYPFIDGQFFRVLVETGLLGLAAFIALLAATWKSALRAYRAAVDPLLRGVALGYLAGFVGLLVHALGANTFIIVRIMEPFWFLTAMVVMIPAIEAAPSAPGDPARPTGARGQEGEGTSS